MKKQLLMKTFLVAVCLLVGTNVWGNPVYFGASTKDKGLEEGSASPTYTIVKGSTTTINFIIETNATIDPWQKWYNWMGQAIHTDGWLCSRGDNLGGCEWHSEGFAFTASYSDGFNDMFTQTNMDGASVALTITRDESNNVQIQSVSKKGSDTWTKTVTFTLSNDDNMTYVLKAEYAYGTINSVVSDKFVGPAANNATWWNNFSDYFTINANKTLTLNFKNYSNKAENWNNFVTVITNDYNRGVTGYAEQVVLRVDDYGWGTNYDHSNFSNNYNWTSFKNDMDGASVELKIRRLDTKVAVKATYTTTSGQKYYQQYVYTSPSGTDPIRVFLTVDNSHITDLSASTADTPVGSNEYLYSVKAVDDSDNELETFASGSYWTGEDDVTVVYPYAIKPDEYWYTTSEATYATTINASNTSVNITYTKDESIVGFYEGETASGNQGSYSNGAYGTVAGQNKRDRGTAAGTLSPGTYQFIGHLVADGNSSRAITLREGTNDPMASLTASNETKMATADFTVYATTGSLYINGANSDAEKTNLSTSFDYVLIKRTGDATVSATIGTTGWATFSSDYALDFSKATEGLEAYMITGHEGNVVTKALVTGTVPAGTGLLLKGAEGSYNIPIVGSSSTDVSSNLMVAGTGASVSAVVGSTRYVLGVNNNSTPDDDSDDFAEFQKIVDIPATVAKGKAYLEFVGESLARSMRFEGDDITGVENIEATAEATLKEGKFIESGKLVIVKNGIKFNAAGQQMK